MKESKNSIGNIAVLLVFCMLALCLLMTLLMGAKAYRNLTARGEGSFAQRTVSQYLSNRIRQADRADAITVEDFEGISALTIRQSVEGAVYLTRIYCYEGWLYELFTAEGSHLYPEDGEKILQAQALSFLLEDRLLTVRTDTGTLTLYLRSGEVGS